ncbi:lipoprotein [Myxococcaceae bacterium GXIMD 01537]
MMDRLRGGLAVAAGLVLVLAACGIKGPPRAPLPPPAAPAPAAQAPAPPAQAPDAPLEPATQPATDVPTDDIPVGSPASGTTRELPLDGGM